MVEKELNALKLKNLLEKEIGKTNTLIEMYSEEAKPVAPDCSIDLLSRNDALNNRSRINYLLEQAKKKVAALEYRLDTIDSPDFGKCVKCRKEIPMERMLVRPESLYCIKCPQ